MNKNQIRLTEECLYARKFLYGKMQELAIALDAMVPKSPGSVLKMIGRPMAKTPMDTSETEHWGMLRATCGEAQELDAKLELYRTLETLRVKRLEPDSTLVKLLYDKERPPDIVKREMSINDRNYYMIRQRVLRQVWQKVRDIKKIDLAVM